MILLKKIHATDFMVLSKVETRLDGLGVTLVLGENRDSGGADSNGVGKSTLFEALTWGLWGQTSWGEKTAVIRKGADAATVTIDFQLLRGKQVVHEYKISRRRTPSATTLKLYKDGKESKGKTATHRQELIADILGLDMTTYLATTYFDQSYTANFLDLSNEARQTLLLRVADPGLKLEAARERIRGDLAALDADIEALEGRMERLQGSIEGQDLGRLRGLKDQWEAERATTVQDLKRKLKETTKARDPQLDAQRQLVSDLDEQAEALEGNGSEEASARAIKAKLQDDLEANIGERADLRVRTRAVDQRVELLKDQIRSIEDDDICPNCGTPTTATTVQDHIQEIREAINTAEEGYRPLAEEDERLRAVKTTLEGQIRDIEELQVILTEQGAERVRKLQEAREALGVLRTLESAENARRRRAESLNAQLRTAEDGANPYIAEITEGQRKRKQWEEQLVEAQGKIQKAGKRRAYIDFWRHGFSEAGLKNALLDGAVAQIATAANEYLSVLSDSDITIALSAQSETKSGTVRNRIGVVYYIEGTEDVRPSGGQRKRVQIALAMAFSKLLKSNAKEHINVLIIDEILDGLDQEGKNRVMELLSKIRSLTNLFVISHDPTIKNAEHDRVWTIIKEGSVATMRVA